MWKKPEVQGSTPAIASAPRKEAPRPDSRSAKARIGSGITLKGELRGEEDIIIEGRVEGRVVVDKHNVIVGESGRVEADISAGTISVAGNVQGDLEATDKIVLLETARVEGNITAKSVTIETGAQFRGSVEMETVASSRSTPFPQRAVRDRSADKKNDSPGALNAG
jgi:cytoskeletal protein CcmA (bactofilin family)